MNVRATALEVKAASIMQAGAAENTRRRWSSSQNLFIRFALELGYETFVPTSPLLLVLWCVELFNRGMGWRSIRQYVDGVNNLNAGFGYHKPWSGEWAYCADRFRKGLIALSMPTLPKLPLTADVLRTLLAHVPELFELPETITCASSRIILLYIVEIEMLT